MDAGRLAIFLSWTVCRSSTPTRCHLISSLFLQESLLEEGGGGDKTFYGSDEDEDEDEEEKEKKAEAAVMAKRKPYVMDPDHRLLLRNTKPLLQSRNAAVRP